MSLQNPVLFLDSPNVGRIGHAYVVSGGGSIPSETELSGVADRARSGETDSDFIAVSRKRVQKDTTRRGHELLICTGAVPANYADMAVAREVLEGLLEEHVSSEALKSEVLQKHVGLIFSAPCLDSITEAFHADPRIASIHWKAAPPSPARIDPLPLPQSNPELKKKNSSLMKWILVLTVIAVISFLNKGGKPEKPGSTPKAPASYEVKELETWGFLDAEEWQRLMQATGGTAAMTAKKAVKTEKAENNSEKAAKAALEKISRWAQAFLHEFSSVSDKTIKASAPAVVASDAARILLQSKVQMDGKTTESVPNWIADYMNQRQSYTLEIQQKAKILEGFSAAFPDLQSNAIAAKLRGFWRALEAFQKVKIDAKGEPLQKLVKNALEHVKAPPENYTTLTFLDADRVNHLLGVLGSKEIGHVLIREPYGETRIDWKEIKFRIQKAPGPDHSSSTHALFKALQAEFLAQPKLPTPKDALRADEL